MNTRKLIEGLYRQKFLIQQEIGLNKVNIGTLKSSTKELTNINNIKNIEDSEKKIKQLSEREASIDELLIEFFGE